MATIKERNGKYCVIYMYTDENGKKKQKWETYATKADAVKRKKEVEYKSEVGQFVVPQCRCLSELLKEYVGLYGKDKWSLSTYDRNSSLIKNYINPIIGDVRLTDVNTRFLEKYYQQLLKTPAVPCVPNQKPKNEFVGTSTIRDVHKKVFIPKSVADMLAKSADSSSAPKLEVKISMSDLDLTEAEAKATLMRYRNM